MIEPSTTALVGLRKIKLLILSLLFSAGASALDYVYKGSNNGVVSGYFNGHIEDIAPDSWRLKAHDNELCLNVDRSGCRKVGLQIDKGEFNFKYKRNYSFSFNIEPYTLTPEWLIIFQDWARIDPLDTNGNHPITTLKIRQFYGQLYLQHWENSWQFKPWNFEADDPYDFNHNHGLEVMRGEYKIQSGETYSVSFDIHDRGYASLTVDGIRVSDADYQTMSYTEPHINYFGMYWSKGFNTQEAYESTFVINIFDLNYTINTGE